MRLCGIPLWLPHSILSIDSMYEVKISSPLLNPLRPNTLPPRMHFPGISSLSVLDFSQKLVNAFATVVRLS